MQLWLAEQVDALPSEVSDWVRGRHTPVASTRARIAETLGRREHELWPQVASDEVAA